MSTIILRADASLSTGGGHVLRSLVIAEELVKRGHSCTFVSVKNSFQYVPFSVEGIRTVEIALNDFNNPELLKNFSERSADALIIDSYELSHEFELAASKYTQKIVVLDDLPERRHFSNLLIDPTLGRQSEDYASLVKETCSLLLGPNYAPIRSEFRALRESSLNARLKPKAMCVLLNFGLTDPRNLTLKILESIEPIVLNESIHASVVMGEGSSNISQIESFLQASRIEANLLIGVSDMATHMADADIILGSPGSSSWERCCLGAPSILTSVAKNQIQIGENLAKAGAAIHLGTDEKFESQSVQEALLKLLHNDGFRTKMIQSASSICDGLGSKRISDEIELLLFRND